MLQNNLKDFLRIIHNGQFLYTQREILARALHTDINFILPLMNFSFSGDNFHSLIFNSFLCILGILVINDLTEVLNFSHGGHYHNAAGIYGKLLVV
jgi:hypothetical protein